MTAGSTRPDPRFALAAARPGPAILLSLVILALGAWALPRVRFEFSLEDLFPRDTPHARAHHEAMERHGRDDGSIVVALEGDPFDPRLAELERLVAELDGVAATASPHSWQVLDGAEGALTSRPLTPGDQDALSLDMLVAGDGAAGAVLIRLSEEVNHHDGRAPIVEHVQRITEGIPGRWHVGGVPVFRVAYVRSMQRDLLRLLPLAALVSLIFFIGALRDWRHVLLSGGILALGTLLTASLLVVSGTPFTIFTPSMLAVVLVVGTSDLVHILQRYAERFAVPEPPSPAEALRATMAAMGPTCLATSATTAVGFLSLLATSIPQIRRFGTMTAAGVMLLWVCTMILLPPALLRLGPPRSSASRRAAQGTRRMEGLGRLLTKHRALGPVLALVLLSFGVSGALRLEADPLILGDVRDTEMVRSNRFLEEHLGAVLPLDVHIRGPEGSARDPELLAAAASIQRWLREQPTVGWVVGLPDLVEQAWRALGEEGLPTTPEALAQVLLMLDMVDPELSASLSADDGSLRIRTRVRDQGHRATVRLAEQLDSFAAPLLEPHGARLELTGVAWLAQEINRTITRQFAGSFLLALLVVGALGVLVYRRTSLVAVALVPNMLPLLALLGLMGWGGMVLQPASAMVFSVALGIAVDDTIHFLAAYRRLRLAGVTPEEAVRRCVATVGRSLVDTSVMLAAGFAVFSVSSYGAMALFGQLTAFCVIVALLSDLLVLGPLLLYAENNGPRM
jgi:predicted RND superfamily exporter protein